MTRTTFHALLVLLVVLGAPAVLNAQAGREPAVRVATVEEVQQIRLTDGTLLVGRITDVTEDSVRIEGELGVLTIPIARIADVRTYPASAVRQGVIRAPDPNTTRLFFAPTGRVVPPGEGYVANHMLFVMSGAAGISRKVTIGGGMTIFPLDDFSENLFFVTPKVGLVTSDRLNVAVGGLFGYGGGADGGTLGVAYGVATTGGPEASVSLGAGWGMLEGKWSSSPVLMGGGNLRLSRRVAAITENYLFPGNEVLVMYGLRMFGERLTADFALVNMLDDAVFPGIPFVGLAYHF